MASDTCTTCGLPTELCVCEDVATSDSDDLEVVVEERRYNKEVTKITGFPSRVDLDDLSSELKSSFACGGTYDEGDGIIELQGDHADRGIVSELEDRGYSTTLEA